jgi:hypothetical protein
MCNCENQFYSVFSGGKLVPSSNSYGLFAQTANSANITNTTTESSLVGAGVGTISVGANLFSVGDSFNLQIGGHLSSLNNQGLTIRLKSDSVALATSGLITLPQTNDKHWSMNLIFTIRSIGSAGSASIQSTGLFTYTKDASSAFEGVEIVDLNNTTFNTTISNTLNITAQWSNASASNSIYTNNFVLTKIF